MIRVPLYAIRNIRSLIISTVQDPDSTPEHLGSMDQVTETPPKPYFGGYTSLQLIAGMAMVFLLPMLVYAGVFFDESPNTDTSVTEPLQNLQRSAALRPAFNDDPSISVGGGGVAMVDESALAAVGGPTDAAARSDEATNRSADEISLYVVRSGDTLSQIGQMFDVSVNTIIWANEQVDSSKDIAPGDTLVILPISGVRHTVKDGETLAEIVEEYDGNLKEVRKFNNIEDGQKLSVGQTITIPNGEMTSSHSRTSGTATAQAQPQRSQPSYAGYYRRPVAGGIRTQGHHGYNAIDIGAARGTPILAAADGTVIVEKGYGYNGGYGRYVVVRHDNGTQTLYAHNSENAVSVGQQVVKGQVIGYMGSTGRSTGPHVHFEVRGARNPF